MKKFTKLAVLLLFIAFSTSKAHSQISIGAQTSYLSFAGDDKISNFGLGIKGEYSYTEKAIITGGFNYFFPSTTTDNDKVSVMQLFFEGKYYFVGDNEDTFGVYGILGAGILFAKVKYDDTTEEDYYYSGDNSEEVLSNFTINGGIGAEKEFNFGYIFLDLKANIPANEVNDQQVSIELPFSFSVSTGIRIPLN